jgi:hypothetical protein
MSQPLQPYPTGTGMPEPQRPSVPTQVNIAAKAMYAGAAASILGIVIELLTISATKTAIEKKHPSFTAIKVNNAEHVLIIGIVAGGVIAAVVWIVIARASRNGSNTARVIGTVLFALATLDVIAGSRVTIASADKIWGLVVWLAGLTAVIFLWQRASTAFFKPNAGNIR